MKSNIIEINNLTKIYKTKADNVLVLDDISFSLKEGEILCIVGSSGCGKSTLLNIISNLDDATNGSITYNLNENEIGYMMQEPALFPWLNIYKNASLGCEIKEIDNKEYIDMLLKNYKLSEFKNKFPSSMSGGMKQRISLIRTVSTKPKLLLMDEPFGALDYQTRLSISSDIYKLIKENGISAIIITHDLEEAISMADRIIVFSSRPAKIKSIYKIQRDKDASIVKNRKNPQFLDYFEKIGKDLDLFNE